ncbi:MAG: hypothetical protein RIC06_25770 [Cyclobacteriaceae bacterium]
MRKASVKIGYAIIEKSTSDIHPQLEILKSVGCDEVYKDLVTNIRSERPRLSDLILRIARENHIDVYCPNFISMFSTIDSFIGLAELIKDNESRLIFLEDKFTFDKDNISEAISIWEDLLHFKVQYRARKKARVLRDPIN